MPAKKQIINQNRSHDMASALTFAFEICCPHFYSVIYSLLLCNTGFVHLDFEVGQWLGQVHLWALWWIFCMMRFVRGNVQQSLQRSVGHCLCWAVLWFSSWISGRSVIVSCDLPWAAPQLKAGHLFNKPAICSLSLDWISTVTFNIIWVDVDFLTGNQEILMKFCISAWSNQSYTG